VVDAGRQEWSTGLRSGVEPPGAWTAGARVAGWWAWAARGWCWLRSRWWAWGPPSLRFAHHAGRTGP